mmetsp:Transcript_62271/g.166862  ORF Transcript_62271/g.166862 Transcript_62271/m.166862 type:complete len:138 (-) Transcript_62271:58-471(-)
MRTEQSSGSLEVYLDSLPEGGVCVAFVAQRDHMVEMVQPVASAVFDYYEPSRRGEEVLNLAVATTAEGQVTTSASPSTTVVSESTSEAGSDGSTSVESELTTTNSSESTTLGGSVSSSGAGRFMPAVAAAVLWRFLL